MWGKSKGRKQKKNNKKHVTKQERDRLKQKKAQDGSSVKSFTTFIDFDYVMHTVT